MTSSEQARADAAADAETLRRFAFATDQTGLGQWAHPNAGRVRTMFRRMRGNPIMSFGCVREAARAAFRAVPGLRG